MFQKLAVYVYHKFRQNRVTFRIAIYLKELGFNKIIRDMVGLNVKLQCSKEEMQEAAEFVKQNRVRIKEMLEMLEDDKSRKVWKAVMLYRSKGRQIPRNLWSDNNQYFVEGIIQLDDGEVFVDGGAFVGDTIQHLYNYAKRSRVKIKEVIAFEPDRENLLRLKKNFERDNRVVAIGKGMSDKNKMLLFSPNGSTGRFVSDKLQVSENMVKIPCTSIDETPDCHNASFIKMDIEGAEMSAIMGARKIIAKNHPKLAICIYHSLEDMIQLIEYVHEKFPEYKLYIRHHAADYSETVLYAVM